MNSITHLNTNPSQTLLKREEKETPPSSFYKASITLYQKQTNTLQENHRANSLMNREPKVFKKNISNKKIMHYDKMCLQGSKDGSTYTNQWMIYQINKMNDKIIISIDAEKTFDKIQHPFTIKTHNKLDVEGMYMNIEKPS